MPRPRKQGLDYFPFDCDFFYDEKIDAVAGEFGIKGEITAIKLLCAIYRNGYFIEWSEMLKMKMCNRLPGISPQLLEQIVNRLVKWGFFDKSLFDSANILTSRGIQRRFFEATRNRVRSTSLPYILDFSVENREKTAVSYEETPVSYKKSTQSKVKNIKISPDGDTKRTGPPPPSPPTGSGVDQSFLKLDLTGRLDLLRGQTEWISAMCTRFHLDPTEMWKLIDTDFLSHCLREGKTHFSMQDLKSHINRWFNKQQYRHDNAAPRTSGSSDHSSDQRDQEFRNHIADRLHSPDPESPDIRSFY